ncbi:T1SS-143 repeat domain-containing protein [Uliginosibacterium sp. H1]|uniref:T1SS-143 repeat domain-containing protein n=1 Tax=Uliginosibacterium sp. H1 TaxID=3114757 RepID=UPI002E18C6EE|nr:hypothetical protein [Uliginosibacterium sp. H1]
MTYILVIDGKYWLLRDDGTLVEVDLSTLGIPRDQIVFVDADRMSQSQVPLANTSSTSIATFFAGITRVGPEILPESGFRTVGRRDTADDTAIDSGDERKIIPPLSPDADVAVDIDDRGDGYINMFEVPVVDIYGTSQNLFDDQKVAVTLTDALGTSVSVTTRVIGNRFVLQDLDLSALAQGPLKVVATVTDFYGNSIAASDDTVVDTLAIINDDLVLNGGTLLNAVEVLDVDLRDSTAEIGAGRTIELVFRDGMGNTLAVSTTLAADGSYEIDDIDLSALADGSIQIFAVSTDVPGNVAERTFTIVKDTIALIDLQFDGAPPYGTSEVATVTLSGQVTQVEAGQVVSIAVTEGVHTINTTAIVRADGSYQTAALDLQGFNDGNLSASASVVDVAGNPASTVASAVKDTLATIDILTDLAALDIDALRTGQSVQVRGSTTEVEAGQTVTLRFSDSNGNTASFTTLVQAGGGWSTNVAITGLSPSASWSLLASVSDVAGNLATDAPPSLDRPTQVRLSEDALASTPTDSASSTVTITGYDELVFAAQQTELEKLTAGGTPMIVSVAGNGQSLTGSVGGVLTLSAQINGNGTITVTLHAPVDQRVLSEVVNTGIRIDATQLDADGTTETVTVEVPVQIREGSPFAHADLAAVTETQTVTGNVFDNDLQQEGPLHIVSITVGGIVHLVSASSPTVVSTGVGLLTVYADGRWRFDAARNQDQSSLQIVEFDYRARDLDGDFDSALVRVNILDGSPGVFPAGAIALAEGDYGVSTPREQAFTVRAGSDDLLPASIRFGDAQVDLLTARGFTSSGQALAYSVSPDGKTLNASAGGNTVFTLVLSAQAGSGGNLDGKVTLRQFLPLDHDLADTLAVPVVALASDIDGTPAATNATLLIGDGNLPTASADAASLDEDNLGPTTQTTGDIDIGIGSDRVTDIGFSASGQPALTSAGTALQYQVSPDGLTLTAHTGNPADPVFVVVIAGEPATSADSTRGYTLTLYRAIDQLTDGQHVASISFNLRYTVSDHDGDVVVAFLPVTIDDASAATGSDVVLQLTELPRAAAHPAEPSSSTVDFALTAGKDPVVAASFVLTAGDAVRDSNGNALTQNGQALVWQQADATTWQAQTAAGSTVLRVSLPASINIGSGASANVTLTATVLGPLDHTGAVTDNAVVPVDVSFADSDGSVTQLTATISVHDGRDPAAFQAESLTVVEHDTVGTGTSADAGTATGARGSDTPVATGVALVTALTSGGSAVSLAGSADGSGWWIAQAGGQEVFRLRVGLNGQTEFRLSAPLDHQPPGNNGNNNLPISFDLTLRDADGDVSNTIALVVNVTDDVPVARNLTVELTEGNNKELTNVLGEDRTGADGGELTKLVYDGVDYPFSTNPIVIPLVEGGQPYGQITVYSDGRATIITNPSLNSSFTDQIQFEVTDGDGDIAVSTFTLDVRDEQADISIGPLVTPEDTPLTLTLSANPGDLDNGEQITAITFDLAALAGGVLTLDGVALPVDGSGNPVLSGANLVLVNPATGEVTPNGSLVFTPLLNSSDPTNDPHFNVTVSINTNGGPRSYSDSFDVSVTPVVDTPSWSSSAVFAYDLLEDGTPPALSLQAQLADLDGSEALGYRVQNIEAGLILRTGGRTLVNGDSLSPAELAALTVSTTPNYAGRLQFDLQASATETSTGSSATITQTVNFNVAPVADMPSLTTASVSGLEDALINLRSFLTGSLADTDGSETLLFQLTVMPGWQVVDAGGIEVGLVSPGVYRVSQADVQADQRFLKPREDISSVTMSLSVDVAAVAVESAAEGIAPAVPETLSPTQTVSISLRGVVDEPAVGPGPGNAWRYDSGTRTISGSFNEDSLIRLDFVTGTEDDDASEVFDFVIGGAPAGVQFVDGTGTPVQLKVLGSFNGTPIYSLTAAELANLYVKPPADFSGSISFELLQTNTEPDGDNDRFDMVVNIEVLPVDDTQDGLVVDSTGAEDSAIVLTLRPDPADIDGSETVTDMWILPPPAGVSLLVDGVVTAVPPGGLHLQQLASNLGVSFDALLDSGRIAVRAPQDSDADFQVAVRFQITDTSGTGATNVHVVTGSLAVDVRAVVDDTAADGVTRIQTPPGALVSTDGSPISLSGAATFVEEDIDGSEYLDYIAINIPESDGWFVTHPNGAINDGNGNWLIPANGLTSASAVDAAVQLLAGATIVSDHAGSVDITVSARVLDRNDDADIISSNLTITFQVPGTSGTATPVSPLQDSIADGQEASPVDLSAHLDAGAAGDANDVVSYRVDAADLPYGGAIAGSGVITEYAGDGTTVVAWVFAASSIGSLSIVGLDEDFAGAMSVLVHKVSTDPSGDTIVNTESLAIEIEPVVDTVDGFANDLQIIEDVPTAIDVDLAALLNDDSTQASEGLETVISVRFVSLSGGSLVDPAGLLVDNGDGTFTLNDPSRIKEVLYRPPQHLSGDNAASIGIELTVRDQTTGITLGTLSDTVTSTVTRTLTVDIVADTDPALVVVSRQTGDEDSDIDLAGLQVVDIDTDGSETLTLSMIGVPEGATLYWRNGGSLQPVVSNGPDGQGGSIWSFTPAQLPDLVLRPPLDFSGDITMTLRATSMELSTQEVVTNERSFVVEVRPVADGAEFVGTPLSVTAQEGSVVTLNVGSRALETVNDNENIVVKVVVAHSSDATALQGLVGIRTPDGRTGAFINTAGGYVATIITTTSVLATLELIGGANAFGTLDVQIKVGSIDRATVGGQPAVDITDDADMAVRSLTIEYLPEPDAPTLDVAWNNILSATTGVPLGLGLTPNNPAPGETGDVRISGLPSSITLSAGTRAGADWIVAEADVANLSITNGVAGESYTLSIEPRSTLSGQTVSGAAQSITVDMASSLGGNNTLTGSARAELLIGGDGSDTLSGGLGADSFLFRMADVGSAGAAANDVVTDFNPAADNLDLSDIAAGMSTGAQLDTIIDLQEVAGTTTFSIDLGGGVVQTIELTGVSRDELYGGAGWINDADILQKMLQDHTLITG